MPLSRRAVRIALALGGIAAIAAAVAWRLGVLSPAVQTGAAGATAAAEPEYVGSAACASCHAEAYAAWKDSSHAHNMAIATAESMRGNFEREAVVEYGGTRTRMFRDPAGYHMDIRETDGRESSQSIDYVLGARRHQVYLHKMPDGQLQMLPSYWNMEQGKWLDVHEGPLSFAPTPLPRTHPEFWTNYGRTYNRACMECHSSQSQKGYDVASNTYSSVFDPQVNCEACHGPAGRHARAWQNVGQHASGLAPYGQTGEADRELPRLGLYDEIASIELCSQCHASKRVIQEGWRPGLPVADFRTPTVWETTQFYVDGRPLDLRYSYVEYMQSACYRSSPEKLSCVECHSPHALARPATSSVRAANEICTRCHVRHGADLVAHTFHRAESDGSRCVECHMPRMDLHLQMTSHDHTIGVPLPALTIKYGVPNACANCHADDSAEWAGRAVNRWWGDRPTFQAYQRRMLERASVLSEVFAGRPPVEPLTRWLDNPAASIIERASAASFLGVGGRDEQALACLLRHRNDPEPLIRYSVVDGLAHIFDLRARDAIREALRDTTRSVRIAAYMALDAIDPSFANDPAPEVAAVRAEVKQWNEVVRVDDPRPLSFLALTAMRRGRTGDAETLLRRSAALSGDVPDARGNLVSFLVSQRRLDEAAAEVAKLQSVEPNGQIARFAQGQLLLARGDAAAARALFQKLVDDGKRNPEILAALRAAERVTGP